MPKISPATGYLASSRQSEGKDFEEGAACPLNGFGAARRPLACVSGSSRAQSFGRQVICKRETSLNFATIPLRHALKARTSSRRGFDDFDFVRRQFIEIKLADGGSTWMTCFATAAKIFRARLASIFRRRSGQIHFVDFSMKGSAADAELFRCGGHIAVRRCERLGNQFLFGLVQIERIRFFAERLSG